MFHPFRKIKFAFQRVTKGYCDQDVWNIDYWFLKTVPKMIKELQKIKHGTPMNTFPEIEKMPINWVRRECKLLEDYKATLKIDDEFKSVDISRGKKDSELANPDRWWIIMSRMAYCLEQADPDNELPNPYWNEIWEEYYMKNKADEIPDKLNKQFLKKARENMDIQMNYEDEGMELFKKYLFSLYD